MNILFLCREYDRKVGYGGIGTYVDIVSRYLAKIGHKVFIICSIPRKTEEIIEKDNLVVYYAKQVHIKGIARLFKILGLESVYSRLMCALTNYLAYKKLSKKYKIDIVETPEWYNEGLFFCIFHPLPIVCRLQTPLYIINKYKKTKFLEYKINNFFEKLTVTQADTIISPTKNLINVINPEFKLKKYTIIPYMIEIMDLQRKETICKKILFVGRLEQRKNPLVVIKAIPYVVEKFPDIKFVFVGKEDRNYKKEIEKIIEKYSLQKYVEFHPWLEKEKLKELYKEVSLILIPSLSESFGYTLIEALSCGVPVVCSKIDVFKELVSDKSVLFADPYNEKEWAECIIKLLTENEYAKSLAENARAEIKEKYSVEVVVEKQLKVYERTIQMFEDKRIIKEVSGFYFALPSVYKKYKIPFKWRKYLLEMSKDYVVWPHLYLVIARQILDCINFDLNNKKVLDLGSTPIISILLALLGAEVWMVDISDEEIEKAKGLIKYFGITDKVKVIKEDLFKINYENEFDIVFNCGVIEHFRNSVAIIKIMKRAVKPNGLVICLVPYVLTLHSLFIRRYVRWKRGYSWDWMGEERSYSLNQLKKEFVLAGLDIKYYSVGNLARNLCDDYIMNFFVNRFLFPKTAKKIVYKLLNICDFLEKYTFLKRFGFICVVCGIKNG
jgi:glycosyltransferase involved in cell wall biosynthesis/SAM-dependent methyltransferase